MRDGDDMVTWSGQPKFVQSKPVAGVYADNQSLTERDVVYVTPCEFFNSAGVHVQPISLVSQPVRDFGGVFLEIHVRGDNKDVFDT